MNKNYIDKIIEKLDKEANIDKYISEYLDLDIKRLDSFGEDVISSIKLGIMTYFFNEQSPGILYSWTDGYLDIEDIFADYFEVISVSEDAFVVRSVLNLEIFQINKTDYSNLKSGDIFHGIGYINEDLSISIIERLYFKLSELEIETMLSNIDENTSYLDILFIHVISSRLIGDKAEEIVEVLDEALGPELLSSYKYIDNHVSRMVWISHYLMITNIDTDIFGMDMKNYIKYCINNQLFIYSDELEDYIKFLTNGMKKKLPRSEKGIKELLSISDDIFHYKKLQKDHILLDRKKTSELIPKIKNYPEIQHIFYYYMLILDYEYIEITPKTKKMTADYKNDLLSQTYNVVGDTKLDGIMLDILKSLILASNMGQIKPMTIELKEKNIIYKNISSAEKYIHLIYTVLNEKFWADYLPKTYQKEIEDIIKCIKEFLTTGKYRDDLKSQKFVDQVLYGLGITPDLGSKDITDLGKKIGKLFGPKGKKKVIDLGNYR